MPQPQVNPQPQGNVQDRYGDLLQKKFGQTGQAGGSPGVLPPLSPRTTPFPTGSPPPANLGIGGGAPPPGQPMGNQLANAPLPTGQPPINTPPLGQNPPLGNPGIPGVPPPGGQVPPGQPPLGQPPLGQPARPQMQPILTNEQRRQLFPQRGQV